MKKVFFTLSLMFLWSCEDPIDLELPTAEKRDVIDATLWRNVNGSSGTLEVILSTTTNYYGSDIPFVSGAEIILRTENSTYLATEKQTGHYWAENIPVEENKSYTLQINTGGNSYSATEELVLSTPLDAVTQGTNTLFSGNETEAIVQFTDRPEEGNYYLIDFGYNNLFVTRDKFYNGNQLTFSFFYDEDFPKNTPNPVCLMGIDASFYTYMQVLISHAGQDGGGPFATAKSTLRGNIQNTSNPDAFPLGYFRVVEKDTIIFTAI